MFSFVVARWSKMARQRLESSGIDALSVDAAHRGLSELRRIKAVFWWCYMHTEAPLEPAEMLRRMPRNKDLQTLINAFRPHRGESIYPNTYGNAVVWSELHHSDPYPYTTE